MNMDLLILGLITILFTKGDYALEERVCWYSSKTVGHISVLHVETSPEYIDDIDYGMGQIQGPNQTCVKPTNYCYALWKEDQRGQNPGGVIIIAQGCWESSGGQDCERHNCVASRKPPKALNDTNFCCCRGNFCNGNVTRMYYPEETQAEIEISSTPAVKHVEKSYILILIVLLIFFIFTAFCSPVVVLMLFKKLLVKKEEESTKLYQDSVHLMENGSLQNSNFTVENLKLDGIIGQGRFGAVWKGSVGDQEVAVKIFPANHKNYFFNELDIYCAPFMAHPSLLSYFGYDERVNGDGNAEYFLFLSLVPNGTVKDYLSLNVVDWNTFCKMALSIAKGVGYLHTDIKKGDKFKPCISHRDLNTKNILVKEDLSCVICDLGFATKISGSKYYYNGEEQHAETKSINDVGTLRYMSPEVLEGAVNLRDCETSLKQIDVYALGLILWEIASRCSDFYPPGINCAPYRLPFEAEIGHPTFEQMQILVCKHKARPLFPDLWRDSPAVRSVKETIEDCWDQDAEARLTALCVEERFHELCGIVDRQRVSLHPCGVSPTTRTSVIQKDSQNVLIVSESKEDESCLSESTMDTLLVITPANPTVNCKNSNHFQGVCSTVQPYQGRNPCLERNLMLSHDCDSNSSELIDKSHKDVITKHMDSSSLVNEYLNVYPSNSSNQNFTNPNYNGYSNHGEPALRPNAPIPFLQNVNVEYMPPKQPNLPKISSQNKKISWKNFKKLFFETKQKTEEISPQIDYNVKSILIAEENYVNLSPSTPSAESKFETRVSLSNGKLETKVAVNNDSSLSKIPKVAAAVESDAAESAAILLGTQNNRRPNTLPLVKSTDVSPDSYGGGRNKSNVRHVRHVDKILRNMQRHNANQKIRNFEGCKKRYSLVANTELKKDRSDKVKSLTEVEELKILRIGLKVEESLNKNIKISDSPKSLVESQNPVKESSSETNGEKEMVMNKQVGSLKNECGESSKDLINHKENEIQLKDPNSRVKTPGDVPLAIRKLRGERNVARFSLFDDRIMSGYYDNEIMYGSGKENSDRSEKFKSFENIKFSQDI